MDLFTQIFAWTFMIVLFLIICINLGLAYYCFYTCKKLINKCCIKKNKIQIQPQIDEQVNKLYINPLSIQEYIY